MSELLVDAVPSASGRSEHMQLELNGPWKMRATDSAAWVDAQVPGTVYSDLLAAGLVPDAYYRAEEVAVQAVFEKDYEYTRTFTADQRLLDRDEVTLCCEGLDTLATVTINGTIVATTNNMHRTYRIPIRNVLRLGVNEITVTFDSPVEFLRKAEAENPGVQKYTLIRKAACSFGWDWGLSLPDSGIWRPIYIEGHDVARLADVYVQQHHKDGAVVLEVRSEVERLATHGDLTIAVTVEDPDGKVIFERTEAFGDDDLSAVAVLVPQPQLWWPAGQGDQPLYRVRARVLLGDSVLGEKVVRVGVRQVRLIREKDSIGRSYVFEVNGVRIFAKGSNMIIPDAILARRSEESARKMVCDSVDANANFLRVWGGAVYPDDYFYDLCDEYGLLLFHDFMFACAFYPVDDDFVENVRAEVTDNVKRARNHASLALWSGNNEVELFVNIVSSDPDARKALEALGGGEMPMLPDEFTSALKSDIGTLFYDVMGSLVTALDPQTSWVEGSPISDTRAEVKISNMLRGTTDGDTHYYVAYDSQRPYEEIRELNARFLSEIGFQSYPDYKTIEAFTVAEDRSPYSGVMLQHQKSHEGNQILETYVDRDFRVPTDFRSYVYATQAVNAAVTATCVEHFRRQTGDCMGYLAWQLNDCWPAVSWAGVDYYGRWKAQQYSLKRAFAPVMASTVADGTRVEIYVNNDRRESASVDLDWTLYDQANHPVACGAKHLDVASQSVALAVETDFAEQTGGRANEHYLAYSVIDHGAVVSRGVHLFVAPKDYLFSPPQVRVSVTDEGDSFCLGMVSETFAFAVAVEVDGCDATFSDNYFPLVPGVEYVVQLPKSSMSAQLSAEEIETALSFMTAFDLQSDSASTVAL
jgi:beta-mannosidase